MYENVVNKMRELADALEDVGVADIPRKRGVRQDR